MNHLRRPALLAVTVVAAMSLGAPVGAASSEDMHWRAADGSVGAAATLRSPYYDTYARCDDQRRNLQQDGWKVSLKCYHEFWGWYFLYNL